MATACHLLFASSLLALLFDYEDGGSMLLRNVGGLLLDYTVYGEYEHSRSQNRGPLDGSQYTKLQFFHKRI
jgi:hypothetical protein